MVNNGQKVGRISRYIYQLISIAGGENPETP